MLLGLSLGLPAGRAGDCDSNGVDDADEIAAGLPDCNSNGIPDDCDLRPRFSLDASLAFSTGQTYYASRLALAGDVDSDGDTDVLDGRLRLYRGHGRRRFTPEGTEKAPVPPVFNAGALADPDSDGDLDLLVADDSGALSRFENPGDGSFALAARFPFESVEKVLPAEGAGPEELEDPEISAERRPVALVVADFDADGQDDVAVSIDVFDNSDDGGGQAGIVAVLRGDGRGAFDTSANYLVDARPTAMVAGDWDTDGILDLAVAENDGDRVALLFGQGSGTFVYRSSTALEFPNGLAVADLDLDGDDDLAVARAPVRYRDSSRPATDWTHDLSLLYNAGDGTFERRALPDTAGTGFVVAAADVDEDGRVDLAGVERTGLHESRLVIFRQRPDGGFDRLPGGPLAAEEAWVLEPADLDGNGRVDLLVGSSQHGGGTLALLFNDGGSYAAPETVPLDEFTFAAVADFDANGMSDLARGFFTGEVRDLDVCLAQPGAACGLGHVIAPGSWAVGGEAADLDGDGSLDIVTTSYREHSVLVFWNDGAGGFRDSSVLPAGSLPRGVVVSDVDEDGRVDIAASASGTSAVSVLLNEDGRGFAGPMFHAVGDQPWKLAAADIDRDGRTDLVTVNRGSRDVSVLASTGGGGFAPSVRHATAPSPTDLAAADLDGDGALDLATAHDGDVLGGVGVVAILLNRGDGGFSDPQTVEVGGPSSHLAAGDIDGDGIVDLAVGVRTGILSVLLGAGDGAFRRYMSFEAGATGWNAVELWDYDEDGDLDGVAGSPYGAVFYANRSVPPASVDEDGDGVPDDCSMAAFVRGDSTADGLLNITDVVRTLRFLFTEDPPPLPCEGSADADASGGIDLSDGIYILEYLFRAGFEPPPPFPECGRPRERLICSSFPPCN